MAEERDETRILAMVTAGKQGEIRRQLGPLGIGIDFISRVAELSRLALSQTRYPVALLPAALPDSGWWELWGEIALFHPRPEFLIYAQSASFQLWSGVLDAGGYDVLVEPFTGEELCEAVLRARRSFEERGLSESWDE